MGYAWDSDFAEDFFEGTPGFVGVSLLLSPGNPNDPVLAEFMAMAERARAFFPTLVPTVGIGDVPGGGPALPRTLALFQNRPNPFNPSTANAPRDGCR